MAHENRIFILVFFLILCCSFTATIIYSEYFVRQSQIIATLPIEKRRIELKKQNADFASPNLLKIYTFLQNSFILLQCVCLCVNMSERGFVYTLNRFHFLMASNLQTHFFESRRKKKMWQELENKSFTFRNQNMYVICEVMQNICALSSLAEIFRENLLRSDHNKSNYGAYKLFTCIYIYITDTFHFSRISLSLFLFLSIFLCRLWFANVIPSSATIYSLGLSVSLRKIQYLLDVTCKKKILPNRERTREKQKSFYIFN